MRHYSTHAEQLEKTNTDNIDHRSFLFIIKIIGFLFKCCVSKIQLQIEYLLGHFHKVECWVKKNIALQLL